MATSAGRVSLLLAHHGGGAAAPPPPSSMAAAAASRRRRRTRPPRCFFVSVRCSAEDSQQPSHSHSHSHLVDDDAAAAPRSVPVRLAYELQQAGHRYLDVRTEGEFSAGHPQGAVNIPYMYKTGSGMTKNTRFLEQVSRVFGKDDEIILGCQSGKRSLMAATELCAAGFTAVTDIAGGFSSWRENELPVVE